MLIIIDTPFPSYESARAYLQENWPLLASRLLSEEGFSQEEVGTFCLNFLRKEGWVFLPI